MIKRLVFVSIIILCGIMLGSLNANPIYVVPGTGHDAIGNVVVPGGNDGNWYVGVNNAKVLSPSNMAPFWAANTGSNGNIGSNWIGVTDAFIQPSRPYVFTLTFNMAESTLAIFKGVWATDDFAYLYVNGIQMANMPQDSIGEIKNLNFVVNLLAGVNTVQVSLADFADTPHNSWDGMRLEGDFCAVVEPTTLLLLGTGILAMFLVGVKSKSV